MSIVAPASSTTRGEPVLQPSYFTSSVYVEKLRADISTLILRYHEAYFQAPTTQPFTLFKTVWLNLGWQWLHFMVFDHRSRQKFIEVTARLFLERTVKTEAPFTRVVAVFGMYMFHYTQPTGNAPPIYSVDHIPIPYDILTSLISMPGGLTEPALAPLRPQVNYVISRMIKEEIFHILPRSDLSTMNPRELPREVVGEERMTKRKGRPPKKAKNKMAKAALEELDTWLNNEDTNSEGIDRLKEDYEMAKNAALEQLEKETGQTSKILDENEALERIREIGGYYSMTQ